MCEELESSDKRKCKWCYSEIHSEASVCPICNRGQSKFWNVAPNVSLLFALIAAVFSGALFIYAQISKIVDEVTWEDKAEIWKLDSIGESIIRNTGDGDVFAASVQLKSNDFSYSFEIGEVVKKGAIVKTVPSFNVVAGRQFVPMSESELSSGSEPSSYVFFSSNAETLYSWRRLLSGIDKKLQESECTATFRFSSLKSNEESSVETMCIVVPIKFM
jgi:hypothetical protein